MKNVLVVDNNPKELITFQEWFKIVYNFDIIISADGEKAIQMLDRESISVFCTGIDIPKVDGIELLAHMTHTHPETPCIAMSEHGVPWFKEKPGRQDILYHIEKPVSPEALTTSIFVGLVLRDEGTSFKGISMHSFLPLVWKNGKTCRVLVESRDQRKGHVDFIKGTVVNAGIRGRVGAEAILDMADWEGIKLSVTSFPNDIIPPGKTIDLLKLFDISWLGQRPNMNEATKPSRSRVGNARPMAKPSSPDKTLIDLVKKADDELNNVQGYQGIAILSNEGNLLAKESVDGFRFNPLKAEMRKILSMSNHALEEKKLGRYEGMTIHAQTHTLIFHTVPTGFHIVVVLDPEGNWYFAKCRVEDGLAQKLKLIV